jgi:predicted nucleic acid-binding protein
MTDSFFLDSNVILYSYQTSSSRCPPARKLMESASGVISGQVVAEVTSNLIKKYSYSETEVRQVTEALYDTFEVVPVGRSHFLRAIELRERFSLSFRDSIILASALEMGCKYLYSEDFQNGLIVGDLTIVNPFANIQG